MQINTTVYVMMHNLPTGHRQYPPGGFILPRTGACQYPSKDAPRRHPRLRNQAELPGGKPAPLQHPHVPAHLRHQHAQTTAETAW